MHSRLSLRERMAFRGAKGDKSANYVGHDVRWCTPRWREGQGFTLVRRKVAREKSLAYASGLCDTDGANTGLDAMSVAALHLRWQCAIFPGAAEAKYES